MVKGDQRVDGRVGWPVEWGSVEGPSRPAVGGIL